MNQSLFDSGKTMASILLLVASSCTILYYTGNIVPSPIRLFELYRTTNDFMGTARSRSTRKYSNDRSSVRSRGASSVGADAEGVGLRAKTSGCGLWHPSVGGQPKTCTNDLDYPLSWNALSRRDKSRLFYSSPRECCMDHFQATANCKIVDNCSEETTSESTTPERSKQYEKFSNNRVVTTSNRTSDLSSTLSRCLQWHPSEEEPGMCTNRQISGNRPWPPSMFRTTHSDCCRDFFKLTTCVLVDDCTTNSS